MKRIIITLALLIGLNLSAQNKKAYQLENGVVKIEQFYVTGGNSTNQFLFRRTSIWNLVKIRPTREFNF